MKDVFPVILTIVVLSASAAFLVGMGHVAEDLISGGATPVTAATATGLVTFSLLTAMATLVTTVVYWTEHHPR